MQTSQARYDTLPTVAPTAWEVLMTIHTPLQPLALTLAMALTACNPTTDSSSADGSADASSNTATVDHDDPIASAMSAAPAAVGKDASIATIGEDGSMTTLREGTNGFTCMPDSPATPGPDPMCMDKNAMAWAMAWIGHGDPPTDRPGIMYMLTGGTDASNTDPYATKPAEGANWIETGPHMMIVGSTAALEGYPAAESPDTSVPYVMWAGTPYAHLMVPVS